jgi:hypothetical protein
LAEQRQELPPQDKFKFGTPTNRTLSEVESYITGYICKRIFKIIGVCKECQQILVTSDEDIEEHKLIKFRDYTKHSLIRPRNKFVTLFNLCYQVAHFYIPNLVTENNVCVSRALISTDC